MGPEVLVLRARSRMRCRLECSGNLHASFSLQPFRVQSWRHSYWFRGWAMADDADIVNELAKHLPVKEAYADVVSPAAKQVGLLAEDIVKTLRLALVPFQLGSAYQDRLRTFIDNAVGRVPESQRVTPPPQILGPVVEGIRYEPEDTPIDEMFSQLLSTSMDQRTVSKAHPSYPVIIKQLSRDEAVMLRRLAKMSYPFVRRHRHEDGLFYPEPVEVDAFPRTDLHYPENVHFYMGHLNQLGLAGIFERPPQEPVFENGRQIGVIVRSEYQLTDAGRRFVSACVAPDELATSSA